MIQLARIAIGVAVVGILGYVCFPENSTGYWLPIRLVVLVSLIGGLLIGSWWSLGLVPATLVASFWLWRRIECAGCPPGHEGPPLWISLLLAAGLYTFSIAGAAAGTFIAKRMSRRRRLERQKSR